MGLGVEVRDRIAPRSPSRGERAPRSPPLRSRIPPRGGSTASTRSAYCRAPLRVTRVGACRQGRQHEGQAARRAEPRKSIDSVRARVRELPRLARVRRPGDHRRPQPRHQVAGCRRRRRERPSVLQEQAGRIRLSFGEPHPSQQDQRVRLPVDGADGVLPLGRRSSVPRMRGGGSRRGTPPRREASSTECDGSRIAACGGILHERPRERDRLRCAEIELTSIYSTPQEKPPNSAIASSFCGRHRPRHRSKSQRSHAIRPGTRVRWRGGVVRDAAQAPLEGGGLALETFVVEIDEHVGVEVVHGEAFRNSGMSSMLRAAPSRALPGSGKVAGRIRFAPPTYGLWPARAAGPRPATRRSAGRRARIRRSHRRGRYPDRDPPRSRDAPAPRRTPRAMRFRPRAVTTARRSRGSTARGRGRRCARRPSWRAARA